MGNYSWFVIATNGADRCVIDWSACVFPEDRGEGYHISDLGKREDVTERPRTIADLGRALDDRKLFGYLDNGYVAAFRQVSQHTMAPAGERLMPRIYFEEEGWYRLHYLEFHPGTDAVDWGTYSFDARDVPAYPEEPVSIEMHAWWKAAKREALLGILDRNGWRVRRLLPSDPSQHSALPTLMALFGIRPEDSDSLERAAKIFDVSKARTTTVSELFDTDS